MNQVRSKFGFKMSADWFCEIEHTFQTVYWIKLKFYREINIRYMKIYCGKFSGQMELGNIIF
jgi:hypothetical protein